MKKFFGLKMTLAALAVVSFASCYDSESGDVVIPNSTTIELPAPLYVVNGSISNLETGAAVQNVAITGAVSTNVSNGYFEVSSNSPFTGDVTFKADGFYDASRSIAQSTLQKGQGTLVSSLNVAMSPVGYIPNGVQDAPVTPSAPVVAEAKTLTTEQVAELISEVAEFTNDGDEPIEAEFSPLDLGIKLPYGAVVAAAKSEESMKQLFIDYVGRTWGNDPFDDYTVCTKKLKVVVPAHSVLKGLVITPNLRNSVLSFTYEGEYFEQAVDIKDSYTVSPTFESLEHGHGHGHGHGDSNNAGGGAGDAA